MSSDVTSTTSDFERPAETELAELARLLDATHAPFKVVHAAARLLESPFVGDKRALVKHVLDNATLLEAQLAAVRHCLDRGSTEPGVG